MKNAQRSKKDAHLENEILQKCMNGPIWINTNYALYIINFEYQIHKCIYINVISTQVEK